MLPDPFPRDMPSGGEMMEEQKSGESFSEKVLPTALMRETVLAFIGDPKEREVMRKVGEFMASLIYALPQSDKEEPWSDRRMLGALLADVHHVWRAVEEFAECGPDQSEADRRWAKLAVGKAREWGVRLEEIVVEMEEFLQR